MEACIIGIGNELRGDDAIGLEIVRHLRCQSMGMTMIEFTESFFDLSVMLSQYDPVFIIDALSPAGQPGRTEIRRYFSYVEMKRNDYSLHDLELFWSIQYAYRRGFMGKVNLIGVESYDLSLGIGLSLTLGNQIPYLVDKVKTFIMKETEQNISCE